MFYENWDEKFIFLDDKIPESNTYLGEISIKTITTMQAAWMLFLVALSGVRD